MVFVRGALARHAARRFHLVAVLSFAAHALWACDESRSTPAPSAAPGPVAPDAAPAARAPASVGPALAPDAPRTARAPHVDAPVEAGTAPRVRARARWFVKNLDAGDAALGWLELLSRAEGDRPGTEARARWIELPLEAGAPRVVRSGLLSGSTDFGADAHDVYFWLGTDGGSVMAMPRAGGEPRPVGPVRYGVRAASDGATVCYVSSALGEDGLFCVPVAGGARVEAAHIEGGSRTPTVLGEWVYWFDSQQRCILRARVAGGAPTEAFFCDESLMGRIDSDGTSLYTLLGEIVAEGERTSVWALDPTTRGATLLHELEGLDVAMAAGHGHVAVGLRGAGGDRVALVSSDGRACQYTVQRGAVQAVAVARSSVFWAVEGETIGSTEIVQVDHGPGSCGAVARGDGGVSAP